MRKILVIGSGRSSSSLIRYLITNSPDQNWKITIADKFTETAKKLVSRINNDSLVKIIEFDVFNQIERVRLINQHDIIISMLPARMHIEVAKDCVALNKHMVTASYVSEEMKGLDLEAKNAGIVLMNEIGVDPGIDHMSAMRVMNEIKSKGGKLSCFETFTGGLVAPQSEDNPWKYKFTWNPRNVVLAGAGGAVKFRQNGQYKYIPYNRVFRRTEVIKIEGFGAFEGYANRDSLKYIDIYGLQNIPTIYRGTLRRRGFCKAWNVFVHIGATDDSYVIENANELTYRAFINLFLAYNPTDSVELKLRQYMKIDQDEVDLWEKLEWLEIFSDQKIELERGTPAQILQHILEKKWSLKESDKDMIVMWHKFIYELEGKQIEQHSSMVSIGEDSTYTAMANTVGLPVAIATKMILNGKIKTPGVHLPITPEIYAPILEELEQYDVRFNDSCLS